MNDLIDFIKMILPGFSWSVVILTILVLIFEFMFLIFLGYLGITIGYRSNQGKLFKSFLSGFIIYVVSSFMSLLILFIVGLFNSNIFYCINNCYFSNPFKRSMCLPTAARAIFTLYFSVNSFHTAGTCSP